MRKLTDLSFDTAGKTDDIERGELVLNKGEKLMGLRLRVIIPLANASGGAVTLTDAQKRTLLAMLVIEKFDYGKGGNFAEPYVERDFAELRRHALRCYQSELEGFNNTTTGLQRSLPNGQTTNVEFTMLIPTGKWAAFLGKFKNRWGMGRSQAETVRIRFRRASGSNTVLTGVTISGTITADVFDDSVPCKGDPWNPIPHLRRVDEAKLTATLEDGLTLAIDDLNAVHVSSALTNISVKIDEQYIHQQISVQRTIESQLDSAFYPSAALLTGEVTTIYETADGELQADQLPTGVPSIIQEGSRQVTTLQLMHTYVPFEAADKVAAQVRDVAVEQRNKDIKAISGARVRGEDLPVRLMPFAGMQLVDRDDREFERFPGLLAQRNTPGIVAKPEIPAGLLGDAKHKVAAHKAAGEDKAATGLIDQLVSAIPGAVQNGRGFAKGSTSIRAAVMSDHFR